MKEGNRKWIEWSVRRAPQQPRSSANVTVAAETAQSKAPSQANGSTAAKVNGQGNGSNGHSSGSNGDGKLSLIPAAAMNSGLSTMEFVLNGATEIAQRIEGRAAARNYCLRFSSEDIRAIGLTMFIQAMREGGVRWQQ